MWMMILMMPTTDFAVPLHAGGIAPVRSGANHRVLIGFAVEEVDGAYVRWQGLAMAWVQELTTQLQHIPFTRAMSNSLRDVPFLGCGLGSFAGAASRLAPSRLR